MPIYEYQCPQCGHLFEEWVKAADAHGQEPCPQCGTPSPRVISQTSFVLKGGGWYVSDYGYRKGIKEEGEAPAPGTSDKAQAADAPPAAAPAASPESPAAAPAKADAAPKTDAPAAPAAPKAPAPAAGGKTGANAAS